MDPLNYEEYILHLGKPLYYDPLYYGAGNSLVYALRTPTITLQHKSDGVGAYKQMEIENPPFHKYSKLCKHVNYANRDIVR